MENFVEIYFTEEYNVLTIFLGTGNKPQNNFVINFDKQMLILLYTAAYERGDLPMKLKKNLLIVDKNDVNRKILKGILCDTYNILEADNSENALKMLEEELKSVACIILDLVTPEESDFDFLGDIFASERFSNIPVLVATIDNESENEKRCFELGAWDVIHKPFNPEIVKLRLKNIIGRSELNTLERIKYVAEHDALTGLYNRNKFFECTRAMLDEHDDTQFAFVRCDIDRFRLINSYFGEDEGDKLIKFMGKNVRQTEKSFPFCTYGRIESDVFCFVVPYIEEVLEKVLKDFTEALINYNPSYYIEPSFGIYIIDTKSISVEKMYARSAMAAKKCKDKYRSYVAFYDNGMTEELFNKQELINDMQEALEKEQFVVYFQPKYSLKKKAFSGAEALVRWNHPRKGFISPGEFIPIFEQNGFIAQLDYYVWEHTCMLLRNWIDSGLNPEPVSVNISRVNMYNPRLVEIISSLTEKYNLPNHMLNLELTESAYMDNPDTMVKMVLALQRKGFIIMMDDFGSGYSSLNTLKDIPVDYLKVDMKFLTTGKSNDRSEKILVSVVKMAKLLDLPVIVEGVETEEQMNFLDSISCEYVQGYYFARPMPSENYEKILREGVIA